MGILSNTAKRLRIALNIRTSEPIVSTLARGFVTPDNGDSIRVNRDGKIVSPSDRPLYKYYSLTGAGLVGEESKALAGLKKGDIIAALLIVGGTAADNDLLISPITADNLIEQNTADDISADNYILIVQSVI